MTSINIQEAKTHLSRYAKRVKAGETIILCERNIPIAEIRPLPGSRGGWRRKIKLGLHQGSIKVSEDFNRPLAEFEAAYYLHDKRSKGAPKR